MKADKYYKDELKNGRIVPIGDGKGSIKKLN